MIKGLSAFVFFEILYFTTFSQSSFGKFESSNPSEWLENRLGRSGHLIGTYYEFPKSRPDSHPFFKSRKWVLGVLNYRGNEFTNVGLLYDLNEDKVVVRSESSNHIAQPILLNQSQITSFRIHEREFVQLSDSLALSGIYEKLFQGGIFSVYTKHKKIFIPGGAQGSLRFEHSTESFMVLNGYVTKFKTPKALFKKEPKLTRWNSEIKKSYSSEMKSKNPEDWSILFANLEMIMTRED